MNFVMAAVVIGINAVSQGAVEEIRVRVHFNGVEHRAALITSLVQRELRQIGDVRVLTSVGETTDTNLEVTYCELECGGGTVFAIQSANTVTILEGSLLTYPFNSKNQLKLNESSAIYLAGHQMSGSYTTQNLRTACEAIVADFDLKALNYVREVRGILQSP